MDEPSLSEHEQRILAEIERNLAAEDPDFVRHVSTSKSSRPASTMVRLGVLGILAGFGLLLLNTVNVVFGVLGFALMLASVVAIARSVRSGESAGRAPGTVIRGVIRRAEGRIRNRDDDSQQN